MSDKKGAQYRADFVRDVSFTPSLFLHLAGCRLEICCSDKQVREQLAEYCAPFVRTAVESIDISVTVIEQPVPELDIPMQKRQPEPGKTSIKEAWADLEDCRVVRKLKTGMCMLFDGQHNLVVGPCSDNPNQVINFINNRFIEWKLNQGAFLGHAAAVTWCNKGVAIAGFSGMGKSTLALHLMHEGAHFVSNDRLLIERSDESGLVMTGVAKWPRINPGTALNNPSLTTILSEQEKELFSSLPEKELWSLEHKYDVLVEECFGKNCFRLQASMDRLCLLNWKFDGGPLQVSETDVIKRPDLLPALMKDTGLFYLPRTGLPKNHTLEEYQELLQHCKVLALSGGIDFQRAIEVIRDWLA